MCTRTHRWTAHVNKPAHAHDFDFCQQNTGRQHAEEKDWKKKKTLLSDQLPLTNAVWQHIKRRGTKEVTLKQFSPLPSKQQQTAHWQAGKHKKSQPYLSGWGWRLPLLSQLFITIFLEAFLCVSLGQHDKKVVALLTLDEASGSWKGGIWFNC